MTEQTHLIMLKEGQRARAVDDAARVISELGEIFRKAKTDKLVRIVDGKLVVVTSIWLRDYLGRHIYFAKSGRPLDPPPWLALTILARAYELQVPVVDTSKPLLPKIGVLP